MRHIQWTVIGIIVVVLAALYIDLPNTSDFFGKSVAIQKGIDLAGGARLLLCAPKNSNPSSADMTTAQNVIQSRAAGGLGVTEPQVNRVGSDCISAEMPGLKNPQQLASTLGNVGYLALTDA